MLPLLHCSAGGSSEEMESLLNRSLTELRGEMYRSGTDLGRAIAPLAAAGARAGELLAAASGVLPVDFALISGSGADAPSPGQTGFRRLRPGLVIAATARDPRMRAIAELALDSLAEPVLNAIRRDEDTRPRGAHRIEALHRLLTSDQQEASETADQLGRRLGLSADAMYHAVVLRGLEFRQIEGALARSGMLHDAGSDSARHLALVEKTPTSASTNSAAISKALERFQSAGGTIAVSAAHRIDGIMVAGQEARFLAALQATGQVTERVASFEEKRALGAWALLFALRRSSTPASFADAALGALSSQDRKGELRRTLRVFLESGGAHGDAAMRLGIHRNTLSYRLRRISELAGVDLADSSTWLTLHIALLASAMPDIEKVARDGSG
jgi:sugar diacid utilization regulator